MSKMAKTSKGAENSKSAKGTNNLKRSPSGRTVLPSSCSLCASVLVMIFEQKGAKIILVMGSGGIVGGKEVDGNGQSQRARGSQRTRLGETGYVVR